MEDEVSPFRHASEFESVTEIPRLQDTGAALSVQEKKKTRCDDGWDQSGEE